jgi:hypothetical protein
MGNSTVNKSRGPDVYQIVTDKILELLAVLYDLLKNCKSFVRLTFQGNGPHGKDKRWIGDLKYANGKFSKKLR